MQGQAYGQSFTGQISRRNSDGKAASSSSKYSCGQRAKRWGSALEPVLEHCELAIHVAQNCNVISLQQQQHGCSSSSSSSSKGIKSLRVLSRLRDSYVKLMNDVATGADLAGMSSSFYGAGFGGSSGAGDFANFVSSPNARSSVNKRRSRKEKDQLFASPPSACA